MKISALSSGSSGNSFYIKTNNTGILIDAGISCKQIFEKLNSLKENPKNISAIFTTHEHADHTRGADVLARNLNIPIYTTKGTASNSFLCSDSEKIITIKNTETIKIKDLEIVAFSKSHDCSDPISFTVKSQEKTTSIITDIGFACNNVVSSIENSDTIIIEANHDENMLLHGPYPYFLKKRISSNKGHISNKHSALAVLEHAKPKLKNIILSHLSDTNNTPQIAMSTYKKILKERYNLKPQINVSLQNIPTNLFKV